MSFSTVKPNQRRAGQAAILAGCLLAGSLGAARAATPTNEVPSVVVSYRDLDLSTAAGARVLYQTDLDGRPPDLPLRGQHQSGTTRKESKACRDAAIERAVNAVNSTQLAALQGRAYEARMKAAIRARLGRNPGGPMVG